MRFTFVKGKWKEHGMPSIKKTKAGMQRQLNGYWSKSFEQERQLKATIQVRDDEIRVLKTRIKETERGHGLTAVALNQKWAIVGAMETALVLMANEVEEKTTLAQRYERLYSEELQKQDTLGLAVGSERKVTDRG